MLPDVRRESGRHLGLIDSHVYWQPARLIVHLVNLTNPGAWRPPLYELVPIAPLHVRVRLTGGVVGRSARLLVAHGTAVLSVDDGCANFEILTVLDHEVVVAS